MKTFLLRWMAVSVIVLLLLVPFVSLANTRAGHQVYSKGGLYTSETTSSSLFSLSLYDLLGPNDGDGAGG